MPKVTVLMAVRDGEPFLRDAIESILVQTYTDFEFLVIDDGSRDRSREIVCGYADRRIRLEVNPTGLGLTPSLNRGLRLARGDLVARQDADDVSAPDRLARQVAFLAARPEVALVGSSYREIDEQGRDRGFRPLPRDATALRWALRFYCPFVHAAIMLRRGPVLRDVGTYDERFAYAQDYDYWVRIADRHPVANLAEPLVRYRVRSDSMTATHPGVASEQTAIGVSAVASVGGWRGVPEADRERRYAALASLAHGPWGSRPPAEALRAAGDALALYGAFCRHFRVPPAPALGILRRVAKRAGRGLARRASGPWRAGSRG